MNEKTLVLVRKTNVLRIYDGSDKVGDLKYTAIYDVTHLKLYFPEWCDIYNKKKLIGFVSGVKEVKEKW